MIKKTIKDKNFLDFFYHDAVDIKLENTGSVVNLFIPRIESKRFAYNEMSELLEDALSTYALSRKTYQEFVDQEKYSRMVRTAISKLKDHLNNTGELGEIFLYCFLESHLNAPKIISKLELKTSSNHYVYGSDGVHLFRSSDSRYQIIFGESKLVNNLTDGITDAISSIKDILNREKNNLQDELFLVTSNLQKETFSQDELNSLISILKPKASGGAKTDKSFGIFVGFELSVSKEDLILSPDQFEDKIRKIIISEVKKRHLHIEMKIEEAGLLGYQFYIYPFPFTDLDDTRKKIIQYLTRIDT